MKPLPDLNDDEVMLLRGKRSALTAARNDAAEALRDASTRVQGAHWDELTVSAEQARDAAYRLLTLAAMWDEVKA
jgi:hypothetical protein